MSSAKFDETTSASLVHGLWCDSSWTWYQFVLRYTPYVYRLCRSAGVGCEDSADIGQEVFQSVARRISSFQYQDQRHSMRGWLRTITRNKIIDHYRRSQRVKYVCLEQIEHRLTAREAVQELAGGEESDVARAEVDTIVHGVRSEFELRSWNAFWLTAVEGRKAADVAHVLGISVNAVYLARSRILRRLRERINDGPSAMDL